MSDCVNPDKLCKYECRDCGAVDEFDDVKKKLEIAIERLKFFAEPTTWARVIADYRAAVDLNKMYGNMARAVLKQIEDLK